MPWLWKTLVMMHIFNTTPFETPPAPSGGARRSSQRQLGRGVALGGADC